MSKSTGLRAPQAFGMMVVALLSVVHTWWLIGEATTLQDIPPSGAACRYDVSGSVGPVVEDGREETVWGVMPTKRCVGSVGGVRVVDDSHADSVEFLAIPVGVAVGMAAWWFGRRQMLRRATDG